MPPSSGFFQRSGEPKRTGYSARAKPSVGRKPNDKKDRSGGSIAQLASRLRPASKSTRARKSSDTRLGRIAAGRKADIALLSLRDPAFAPLNDAVRQLVYTEPGRSVRHVIVDGRLLIDNGRVTMLDEDALYADVERLMPALTRDLEAIRKRNAPLMPYVEEANRRTRALDVGIDRYKIMEC